jgi:DNA repair protein RecN (Recombination protein N)
MLRQLRVGNLALAADVAVAFDDGLTVLTGETGAGKSLVAGALALLAGGRADRDMIRSGEDLAFVEGVFDLEDQPEVAAACEEAGLRVGDDGVLVLRRELKREGRGRVLINGLISSQALLDQIGGSLVAVQSQDQQRRLGQPTFAVDLLDGALGLGAERDEMEEALAAWRRLEAELGERRREEEFARQQLDMWTWQKDELERAGLDADEEARLAEEIAVGRGARGLLEAAAGARDDLVDGQPSAVELLGQAARRLERKAGTSARLDEVLRLVLDAQAAAEDAARGLERFLDGTLTDPARLDELEERKALYEELQRKYRRDVAGLVALLEDLQERIGRQAGAEADLRDLEQACEEAGRRVEAACLALRERRRKGARAVAARATERIRPLSLPDLELSFRIEHADGADGDLVVEGRRCRVGPRGADRVVLEVRTNRGEAAGDVARIASGGERSRIYLGLTAMGLGDGARPVLLFDEIDAGLGLEGAVPVADLLLELARRGQVLCITHMPTVAARGRHHLKVAKATRGDRTTVAVERIEGETRLEEVARLLGGEGAGDAAGRRAYAAELLGPAHVRREQA